MKKQFVGQIGRIKPEYIETYCRLHEKDIYTEEWKGIRQLIADCNIKNYHIFIEDDIVFACYEYVGEDYAADMRKMSENPLNKKWWGLTRACFTKYKKDSKEAFYSDMKQIFYLE